MAMQNSIQLEYALTRPEIFRYFLESLTRSPRFLSTIAFYSACVGIMVLLIHATILRSLTARDAVQASVWALASFIFMPVWVSFRGKTSKRTVWVHNDGISSKIDEIRDEVPWGKVAVVKDCPKFVLIACTNGNAFFIPHRAFGGSEQRRAFITAVLDARTKQP